MTMKFHNFFQFYLRLLLLLIVKFFFSSVSFQLVSSGKLLIEVQF